MLEEERPGSLSHDLQVLCTLRLSLTWRRRPHRKEQENWHKHTVQTYMTHNIKKEMNEERRGERREERGETKELRGERREDREKREEESGEKGEEKEGNVL